MIALGGIAALIVGLIVFNKVIELERTGRSVTVTGWALAIGLVDLIAFRDNANVPVGVFRLPLGAFDVRWPDIILLVVLGARALNRRMPSRISGITAAWGAFLALYLAGGVTGFFFGNSTPLIIFQARGALMAMAGLLLIATTDVDELMDRDRVRRGARVLAVAIVVGYAARFAIGGVPLGVIGSPEFGSFGTDAVTVFAGVGMVLMALAIVEKRDSALYAGVGVLAIFSTALVLQGAALLGAFVGGACGLLFVLGPTFRRRLRLTGTQISLFVVALITLAGVGLSATGQVEPIIEDVELTLFSQEQVETSTARELLWSDAVETIREYPLFGRGLGFTIPIRNTWPEPVTFTSPHNVPLEAATRSGLPALAVLVFASLTTLAAAARVWRRHPDPRIAAVAVGAALAVTNFLGKGAVESVFDKPVLALGLGLFVGLIVACVASTERALEALRHERELDAITRS